MGPIVISILGYSGCVTLVNFFCFITKSIVYVYPMNHECPLGWFSLSKEVFHSFS